MCSQYDWDNCDTANSYLLQKDFLLLITRSSYKHQVCFFFLTLIKSHVTWRLYLWPLPKQKTPPCQSTIHKTHTLWYIKVHFRCTWWAGNQDLNLSSQLTFIWLFRRCWFSLYNCAARAVVWAVKEGCSVSRCLFSSRRWSCPDVDGSAVSHWSVF